MKRKAFTAMMAAVVALTAVSGTMLPENAPLSLTAEAASVKEEEKPVEGKSGSFTYLKYPKYIEISGVDPAVAGKVELPDKIDNLPVTVVGKDALAECKEMTELVIPDSVLYMNIGAVASCPKLKKVKLSQKLTSIPARAFEFCKALEEITLPDSINAINAFAFDNCTSLKEITVPNQVTLVDSAAFRGYIQLEKVKLGTGVKKLGN